MLCKGCIAPSATVQVERGDSFAYLNPSTRIVPIRGLPLCGVCHALRKVSFFKSSFGNSHEVGYSILLQPDGKIVVAGYSASFSSSGGNADFALVRYNSNGSLDTTFDGDGKVTTDFSGGEEFGAEVLLQPDGKILVAESRSDGISHNFALARYNGNGSLDTTFDLDGKVTTDFVGFDDAGEEIVLQADGKILVAGTSNNGTDNDFALARYNSNGSLDATFDHDGKLTTDFGYNDFGAALLLQTNGRIVVVGNSVSDSGDNYGFALARYNSAGSLDSTFDLDGKVIPVLGSNSYDGAAGAALQPDGKIFVAGRTGTSSDFTLVRYNSNGSLDAAFGTSGKVITSIVVGGLFTCTFARLVRANPLHALFGADQYYRCFIRSRVYLMRLCVAARWLGSVSCGPASAHSINAVHCLSIACWHHRAATGFEATTPCSNV